jgi:hypothetical protein
MEEVIRRYFPKSLRLVALALWAVALPGQSAHFLKITPEKANLLLGESRTFRLIDQNGQMQSNVTWTVSDPDAFQTREGNELSVTAKRAGDFSISAHTADGSADATIKVVEGNALPQGEAIWSGPSIEGCKTMKITPAVPSASGVDVYEQSLCEDGEYLSAYTSDGIEVWRQKIGQTGPPHPAQMRKDAIPAGQPNPSRLNTRSASICDSVEVGSDQQKIRDLLSQRNRSFSEGAPGERVWTVDEPSTQCKIWFDEKLAVTKKRKTFVSE